MEHFKLLDDKLLGEGAFGKVHQCLWHGNPAAAKQFNIMKNDETKEITKEIEIIKKLRNDYIIQFFGTVHHNGKLCLITSYAENGSLRRALAHRTLIYDQKPSIITGLIRGMLYLKSNNVVHRDLKSPNVLLDMNNVPKICDFGLALLKLNSATLTMSSSPKGTTRWMAPELLEIKPRYSFASDMYALGIVIWEILTEQLPYDGIVYDAVIIQHINAGKHDDIPDSLPEHYKFIINSCWKYEPQERITVEEISKVNDKAIPLVDTPNDSIYNEDIPASTYAISIHSESTFSEQQPTTISRLLAPDVEKNAVRADHAKILNQYLEDTCSDLENKTQLASALKVRGSSFTNWIKATANQGNDAAITVLGEMYFHGCGVPQSYQAAFKHFLMVAKTERPLGEILKENARAQCNLGWMYKNGRGVPQSDNKAVEWYTKSAEQGNVVAQYNLGNMYLIGRGVPKSDEKAAEWYTKAAEQGNANAQHNLGNMYCKGRGVPQSDDKAFQWFTKAAKQGNEFAQHNLGWIYESGKGVPQSDDKAVEWYTKAAEQGNASAQYNLGNMYFNGQGVRQNDSKAVEWYTKAAEQGDADAQFTLGQMYEKGRHVPRSDGKAVGWYTKAAEQGDADAQYNLGRLYLNGQGVPQSDEKSVEWYTKAAEQDHAVAQACLGSMYLIGRGVPQSDHDAVEWYTKAAEQGHASAQYTLGQIYQNGQGVPQSDTKAVAWFTKAAEQDNANAKRKLQQINEKGLRQPFGGIRGLKKILQNM